MPPISVRRARPGFPLALATLALIASAPLSAQTIDDGLLVTKGMLDVGFEAGQERWTDYWEGTLKRDNESIGTVTTRNVTLVAGFGVTDRLSVLAMLPYVQTRTTVGILNEMRGIQDVVMAAKYSVFAAPVADAGALRAFVVGSVGLPIKDYSEDFLPLSIGLGARRASGRATLNFQASDGWFLNASSAYTWRGNVELDRAAYYTNGHLYETNEVEMPNVLDYAVGTGYRHGGLHLPLTVTTQRTLGGGDIRRQDMPFVSNRMDFTRVDAAVAYTLPAPCLMFRVAAGHVVRGRNVGQGTSFSGGIVYALPI
jgi:hypothetical protein